MEVKKVISIVITDERLIDGSEKYHHRFTLYDRDAGIELTDLVEINTLELPKLPKNADGTVLYDWASFIAAETEEELKMVAERNPEVKKQLLSYRSFLLMNVQGICMKAERCCGGILLRRLSGC